MHRSPILIVLLLAACRADGSAADETYVEGTAAVSPLASVATVATVFDPASVQPGDTVLGLRVVSKNVDRVFEDSLWIGNVVFEGDLVVQGVYQPHPDWPQVTAPCFHVTDAGSVARVPRFPPGDRIAEDGRTWFCFADPAAALDLLGSPEQPREVVIAVDRYRVRRDVADTFDTAELMEVIDLGPAADLTLRER
jgi:hypothetical protein